MSLRRRLTALEQHTGAAGSRTSPDRLSREEIDAVVDLAKSGDATPVASLSPLALDVLAKARHFTAFLSQMANRRRDPHE
jgi:hypothetical protein